MTTTRNGGCLCGDVRFRINEMPAQVSVCHCAMCRRWAGGPMHAVYLSPGSLIFEKSETLGWFESSDWASRGFCRTCGSSLFYRFRIGDRAYVVSAGALDDVAGLKFQRQIFIDEKPDYFDFAGAVPAMTGAEVLALHAPPENSDESLS